MCRVREDLPPWLEPLTALAADISSAVAVDASGHAAAVLGTNIYRPPEA
jgi:hypothetical protein